MFGDCTCISIHEIISFIFHSSHSHTFFPLSPLFLKLLLPSYIFLHNKSNSTKVFFKENYFYTTWKKKRNFSFHVWNMWKVPLCAWLKIVNGRKCCLSREVLISNKNNVQLGIIQQVKFKCYLVAAWYYRVAEIMDLQHTTKLRGIYHYWGTTYNNTTRSLSFLSCKVQQCYEIFVIIELQHTTMLPGIYYSFVAAYTNVTSLQLTYARGNIRVVILPNVDNSLLLRLNGSLKREVQK